MTSPCDDHSDPHSIRSGLLRQCAELRWLADLTEDLFSVTSLDGCFLSLNPAWERTLGWSMAELTSQPFMDFVHPDDREATEAAMGVLAIGQPVRLFTNRYRCKDGSYRYLTWNSFIVQDQGVIYAIARDVTAVREQELITSTTRAELERTSALLDAIRHVHQLAFEGNTPDQLFDFLLGEILRASGSEYGFIGEVLREDDGRPYLKTQAITNIAWNDETRHFYEENAPSGMEFRNLKTLFGAVLTSGEPLIANDPPRNPHSGGLPDGHPSLDAFLGLPLSDGDGMVGMLGVANRPDGYDQALIDYLEPLSATTARLIRAFQERRLRDEAEEELRGSERRWRRSLELAAYPVLVWDAERQLIYVNKAAANLLDARPEDLVGQPLDRFILEPDIDHEEALERYRDNGWSHRLTYLCTLSGDERPVELQAVDLGDGTCQAMAFDMRDWVTIEARLKEASQRDNLTGLLNRRAIEEHAEVEIQRARRRASHVAMLLLDVDHFKRINDVWGHLAGDIALQRVAEILTSSVRHGDWVGRWGGEEFLIILPETNESQAHLIAERMRTAVAGMAIEATSTSTIPLTVSIGLAAVGTGATPNLRRFVERVDQALYAAKREGRDRTVCWSDDLASV